MADWAWMIVLFVVAAIVLTIWIMHDLKQSVQRRRARHRVDWIDRAALKRITDSFAVLQSSMSSLNASTRKAGEALAGMREAIVRAEDDARD